MYPTGTANFNYELNESISSFHPVDGSQHHAVETVGGGGGPHREGFYHPVSSADPPFKGAYKTELCRYVLADTKCRFGAARCKWAHSIEEMHQHRRAILNQARRHYDGGKMYRPRTEPRTSPVVSVAQLPLSIWDELQSCSSTSTPPAGNFDEGIFGTSTEPLEPMTQSEDTLTETFPATDTEDILECLATLQNDMGNLPSDSGYAENWENGLELREGAGQQQQQPMVEISGRQSNNDIDEGCSIQ
ncbi:hypothetical protein FOZ61_000562 [Perkinsus olseni]|uniref:C3H1-type domain-containing protein n=1 Tax=Perkinsus olseni TaxID=32597 RepID=A0A7J6MH81_PEROL|nr:hypothetical protein FOZ61_000562 [Perkinsus olseni]KAF4670938.1 hypothetical protein FOL46_000560 [Perkinsus olseni]